MYDFGFGHPMRPLRLELTMALARGLSLFDAPGVRVAATGRRNRSMRQRASPRP